MITRRALLNKSFLLAGASIGTGLVPGVIQKAMAIAPDPGTTFLDAEHIVILMQENRSFDHMLGTLRGVRGFNDKRTLRQPDGTSIFIQRDNKGRAFTPWHAALKETKVTWMGDTPHARSDHLDAWNGGIANNWITAKVNHRFPDIPVTMGYHNRADLPFYHALADAFTVCDQNFCGSLTETTPNRLIMWSGTVREKTKTGSLAYLKNAQTHPGGLTWTSFPERLEEADVSWKCYQNDSWCESPLSDADADWLGNDGDNTMERFAAIKPNFAPQYRAYTHALLDSWLEKVRKRKAALQQELGASTVGGKRAQELRGWILAYEEQEQRIQNKHHHGNADLRELSEREKSLHAKAITKNSGDPDFRTLEAISFTVDGRTERMSAPKGDVLHQFRHDVQNGSLPTVSWLIGAANFSAHPGRPLYGAWYASEVLNILAENPSVWKKTIFILTFDENDGLFDHIPPFVACDPKRAETGKVSAGLDPAPEYAYAEDERIQGTAEHLVGDGPIGLGYRVPMFVASPWTRGGWVNSQIFDHSSIIRFIEKFVEGKFDKKIRQEEISSWRRAVSGDLTSCFRSADEMGVALPFLERNEHLIEIQRAQYKPLPNGFKEYTDADYSTPEEHAELLARSLWQEEGTKASCSLPYELTAQGRRAANGRYFDIELGAGSVLFGKRAAGAPFAVYLRGVKKGSAEHSIPGVPNSIAAAHYAVKAGDVVSDNIDLDRFDGPKYEVEIFGPNGFYRQFTEDRRTSPLAIRCVPVIRRKGAAQAALKFTVTNAAQRTVTLVFLENQYRTFRKSLSVKANETISFECELDGGSTWYDVSVSREGDLAFAHRYAGRVETGQHSISDPAMGVGHSKTLGERMN